MIDFPGAGIERNACLSLVRYPDSCKALRIDTLLCSIWLEETICPFWSKTMNLVLVVPWSMAPMYFMR